MVDPYTDYLMSPFITRAVTISLLLTSSQVVQADSSGTLDRLVAQVNARFVEATKQQPVARQDLALAMRRGAGEVPPRLVRAVRDLLMGKLTSRGFRSVAAVAATNVNSITA